MPVQPEAGVVDEAPAKKQCVRGPAVEEVLHVGFDGQRHEYCPYDETSTSYDATRAPLGLNVVLGSLCLNGKPLHEQRLLDVGCGTGTFIERVKDKMGGVTGLEYNEGMLVQARSRLGESVSLVQGSADKLPFEEESFDACTIHQVMHHFPTDDNFAFARRSIQEAYRVLKPGGCLVINTSTPEQQRDAFWWLSLFPRASEAICRRFPPLAVLQTHLEAAGFGVDADSVVVPLRRTLMAQERYLEHGVQGAFLPSYRAGDSSWAMAENCGELQGGLAALQEMIDGGRAEAWLQQREALRLSMGQATFITARKPRPATAQPSPLPSPGSN